MSGRGGRGEDQGTCTSACSPAQRVPASSVSLGPPDDGGGEVGTLSPGRACPRPGTTATSAAGMQPRLPPVQTAHERTAPTQLSRSAPRNGVPVRPGPARRAASGVTGVWSCTQKSSPSGFYCVCGASRWREGMPCFSRNSPRDGDCAVFCARCLCDMAAGGTGDRSVPVLTAACALAVTPKPRAPGQKATQDVIKDKTAVGKRPRHRQDGGLGDPPHVRHTR